MDNSDIIQNAEVLLSQGHYREAAQLLKDVDGYRSKLLLINALASINEIEEAWRVVESVEGGEGFDWLWTWLNNWDGPKTLDLAKISREGLEALTSWVRGATVNIGNYSDYSARRNLQAQLLLEEYARSQAVGDMAESRKIARALANDGWADPMLSEAWLRAAWQATQTPEVLALLIKRLGQEEDINIGVAYLADQGERSSVLIPALVKCAVTAGQEVEVRRLLALSGVNWGVAGLADDLTLLSSLFARILHPITDQNVPVVGTRQTSIDTLRWGLLRCAALKACGHEAEALTETSRLLEEYALCNYDFQAGGPDGPQVYGLIHLPEDPSGETEMYIDADSIWRAYLGEVVQNPDVPARLRALAHLGMTLPERYDEMSNDISGRDVHIAAALELAEGAGELWALHYWRGSGDELMDLKRYSRALACIPEEEREGYEFRVRNKDWQSSSSDQALEYHQVLMHLPIQLGFGNLMTHMSAFDADWRVGLERFKLHAEAIEACRAVLSNASYHKDARFFLAYHLLALNEDTAWKEAREVLHNYLSEYPNVAAAWNNLGVALVRLKRYDEAADAYDHSARLNPEGNGARMSKASRERGRAEVVDTGLALMVEPDAPETEVALGRAYWRRQHGTWAQTVTEVGRSYGVRGTNVAAKVFPFVRAVDPRVSCTRCGTLMTYSSRSDYTGNTRSSYVCQECQAAERQKQRVEAERLNLRRQDLIRERYAYETEAAIDVASLTLSQAVKLLALIRARATEDMRVLRSEVEANDEVPLGASGTHSVEILRELYRAHLIEPHPSSTVEAFEWDGEDSKELFLDRARFTVSGRPALGFANTARELAQALRGGPESWPEHWRAELGALWRELVRAEALANLEHQLRDYRLQPRLGEKTEETLHALVEDFSLGQIWNLIWQGVTSAASFKQKTFRPTNDHAVNVATSTLRKRGEHYRAEGLGGPKPSRRDWSIPTPQVSQVFFIHALGLTEEGYVTSQAPA